MIGRRSVLAAALTAAALAPSAAEAAKPRADLVVSKAAASPRQVAAGAQLTVTWTVKNGGRAQAGKSTTALLLSTDAKQDRNDKRLGTVAEKLLKAGKAAVHTFKATIPAATPARRYTLLVCADTQSKVGEGSEKNNCRAAATVEVVARSGSPVPLPAPMQVPSVTATPTAAPTPVPLDTIITESPATVTAQLGAQFAFTSTRAGATFECRLDGAPFSPCISPRSYSSLLAGPHSFAVRASSGGTVDDTPAVYAWRIEFEAPAPGPQDAPAPPPETRASTAQQGEMTLVGETTRFLYTGADPIQKQVTPGAIEVDRAAVLRGRATRRNGSPIDGVRVTVAGHPELGRTATRTDGGFEIAVNGGGSVTLTFEREGYVPSQRQLEVPAQEYERVEEIVLVPYDDRVTGVDLAAGGDELKVAQGASVTDGDGTRRATLMFEPGTDATATLANGTTMPLDDRLNIRATEFTIGASGPAAMPGELPPTSAYTYAVEYSVDEASAAKATDVKFDKPVVTYVDNYLRFPAGQPVPMGYYDREKGQWIPAPDGIVVDIVGEAGGRAQLDVDGDGAADSAAKLAALGIDAAELESLAELYAPGKSLWRAAISHFTPWDYNWPYGLPDGAGGPGQPGPDGGDPDGDDPCGEGGSIILCETQVLGEQSPIAGTPYTLTYQSDRVPGRRTGDSLEIPLTGAAPPASLARVELEIEVAGRTIAKSYPRAANLAETFIFDGRDAYGRPVQGRQRVDVRIDYVYGAIYRSPGTFGSSFAAIGGETISANRTRQEISIRQSWSGVVGGITAPPSSLAGWNVDVHHAYDPIGRTLYLGNGTKRSAEGQNFDVIATKKAGLAFPEGIATAPDGAVLVADSSAHVVRRVAADGTATVVAGTGVAGSGGDGGPATAAQLNHPSDVALAVDGSILIADESNNRIRKVAPTGTISTIAGTGTGGYAGDGGPAPLARLDEPSDVAVDAEGAVYVVDRANHAVRRIGSDGIITSLAGNGSPGFAGDGGVATSARLRSPRDVAVREDGSVFVADAGNHRVRRIDPDGTIETVAGNGSDAYTGDGGLATGAALDTPSAVLPLRDGGVLVADAGNAVLRKIASQGTISTVAGNGTPGFRGDGGPAAQARIDYPQGIALGTDDTVYVADAGNDRIRALAPSLPGLGLGEFTIASEDGRSLFVFDRSGRHLRTLDTLTKAPVLRFSYDAAGRLTGIKDGDGQDTVIERNASGAPTAIVGPYGQITALQVSAGGYLSRIANPAGDQILATYDGGGLLKTLTDPRGGTHGFDYDTLGRLVKDTAADGSAQTLARTVSGGAVSVTRTSGEGRVTVYKVERTAAGSVRRTVTDGEGRRTITVAGNDGITTVTRSDGTQVAEEVGPDPRFGMQSPVTQRLTITTPSGLRATLERSRTVDLADPGNALSLRTLVETSTVNGRIHTTRYDAELRRFTDTAPSGRALITEIDAQARPIRVEATGITASVNTFDARGRLTRTAQGTRSESYSYDARGRVATITDGLDRTTEFTYDLADRPATQRLPDGRTVAYSYDRNGNLLTLTPPGKPAHTFAYTARNLIERYTPPLLGATPGPTVYTADRDELITGVSRPDGGAIGFSYDGAGRLEQLTQPRGATQFTYSPQTGRVATATAPGSERITYAYDGSLPTRATVTGTVAGEVNTTFDTDFRVLSETVAGSAAAGYLYDADGLLVRAGAMNLTRDPGDGLISGLSLASSNTTMSHSSFGEPDATATKHGTAARWAETFGRDNTGRIISKTESRTGAATSYAYTYDAADRLAQVSVNGTLTASYTYDLNGNRTAVARTGEAPTAATYDAQDRLLTYGAASFTYTAAGELATKVAPEGTTSYEYDALGALTRVELPGAVQFDYAIDPAGRRIAVKRNGVLQQRFLYGRGLGPVAELNADGTVKSRFVYATHSNVPDVMIRDGKTYRVVTDQVGSPRAIVDTSAGTVIQELDYDEFGRVTRDTNPGFQPFGFGGGLYDRDTKLVRFGARDYDPETGRFTAKDPLFFAGGDTNLYGYALADPVNLADPTGQILDTILDIGFIAYDLYNIGKSLMNGCGVSGTDMLALGADVAGALIPFATGGGAAVRAASHAGDGKQIAEGIYQVVTKEGLPYVGQSGDIATRLGQHVRSGKITQEAADAAVRTEVMGGKTAREIAEQRRINEITNGVGAADPGIANKVNPIGPKRQHLLND